MEEPRGFNAVQPAGHQCTVKDSARSGGSGSDLSAHPRPTAFAVSATGACEGECGGYGGDHHKFDATEHPVKYLVRPLLLLVYYDIGRHAESDKPWKRVKASNHCRTGKCDQVHVEIADESDEPGHSTDEGGQDFVAAMTPADD